MLITWAAVLLTATACLRETRVPNAGPAIPDETIPGLYAVVEGLPSHQAVHPVQSVVGKSATGALTASLLDGDDVILSVTGIPSEPEEGRAYNAYLYLEDTGQEQVSCVPVRATDTGYGTHIHTFLLYKENEPYAHLILEY